MPQPFFAHTSDRAVAIRGYERRATDHSVGDSCQSIFGSLESADILASSETRLFTCFRFLPTACDWGTSWRKHQGKACIGLDLVFLTDVILPFYGCTLPRLSVGLQRLVIGLATQQVFADVVDSCAARFLAWGHPSEHIHESLLRWFDHEGYTQIPALFSHFENDTNLSDCEDIIPWLDLDDIFTLYERFVSCRADFTARLDSSHYYQRIGAKPKNKKK